MAIKYSTRFLLVLTLACCISAAYYANYAIHYRKAQIVYYYEQLTEHMAPGSSRPNIPFNQASLYFEEHSQDIALLDDVLHDQDPWRRWIAAKTMGGYGERACISFLRKRLEIEKTKYVRSRISQAIEELIQRTAYGG